ncbi:hypothetical protein [Bacillus mycoides]|uniref:hypothetical protein n=1 Tax=Bacillus mycoides TaxID=1405 RepID=UPI001C0343C2|nr:hypothetical protein [Bacillus mycoides]
MKKSVVTIVVAAITVSPFVWSSTNQVLAEEKGTNKKVTSPLWGMCTCPST